MLRLNLFSDRQIIERIKTNDRLVLGEIFNKYQRLIYSHVLRNGGDEKDAEDILQETIIVLWQKVNSGEFELTVKLSTYLFAIAKNKWMAQLRKMRRSRMETISESMDHGNPSSLENILDHEKTQIIREALDQISPICKKLLLLFYFEGRSMTDIADILGLANPDVAKSKKYQCKNSLKEVLKNKMDEFKGII